MQGLGSGHVEALAALVAHQLGHPEHVVEQVRSGDRRRTRHDPVERIRIRLRHDHGFAATVGAAQVVRLARLGRSESLGDGLAGLRGQVGCTEPELRRGGVIHVRPFGIGDGGVVAAVVMHRGIALRQLRRAVARTRHIIGQATGLATGAVDHQLAIPRLQRNAHAETRRTPRVAFHLAIRRHRAFALHRNRFGDLDQCILGAREIRVTQFSATCTGFAEWGGIDHTRRILRHRDTRRAQGSRNRQHQGTASKQHSGHRKLQEVDQGKAALESRPLMAARRVALRSSRKESRPA